MPTLVLDPAAYEIEALLERRRRSGVDLFDEVWEGVLHVVPAPNEAHARIEAQLIHLLTPLANAAGLVVTSQFNLGEGKDDFRVPDGALHRETGWGTWAPTAALVIEIVSPGDESWQKQPFYAAHGVDEILIVDPSEHAVHWLALTDGEYRAVERSRVIDLGALDLAARIDWPAIV
ncbi:MAG: Uma2 family endonuclease [Actinomycetota bacterium]|nr:Uma2 family endonuclease [Actinomycetota bacterium]